MEKFTIEQILEAISHTGFIFEQKVASIIEKEGFLVRTNVSYLDPEENKSREIDIVAHKEAFAILDHNIRGMCYLICECKDSENPYVFFTRKKMWGDRLYRPREIQLLHEQYFSNGIDGTRTLDGFYYMQLNESFTYLKSDTKAVQVCKIVGNKGKPEAQSSGLVDSLIFPMAKAFLYNSSNAPKSNQLQKYCKMFFNIIVVSAELFTLDTEDANAVPTIANFVPFVRDIKSKELDGSFLTYFVTVDYLRTFIREEVFGFANAVFTKYSQEMRYIAGPQLPNI